MINKSIYNMVDTEEKAYFLGFLYADGNVFITKDNCIRISCEIQDRDKYILDRMKDFFGFEGSLSTRKRNINWKRTFKLCFHDKEIGSDLIKLGCVPTKSFVIRLPDSSIVPDYLLRHFVRGFFDGDGGFRTRRTSLSGNLYFTSNPNFCFDLFNMFVSIGIENKYTIRNRLNRRPIGDIQIYSLENIRNIHNYMYKDASIFLSRKREKISDYILAADLKKADRDKIKLDKQILQEHFYLNRRKYKVTFPNGEIKITDNLYSFSKNNNINYKPLLNNFLGKTKNMENGFKCEVHNE